MATKAEHEVALRERFGDVLTLSDLASVLRYPSTGAIRKARARGQLPLQLVQMPPRRGWFATVEAVAELLCNLEDGTHLSVPNASQSQNPKEVTAQPQTR